jgi:hypothetical protein
MKNESEFRIFLEQMGKKPHVIDGLVEEIHHFEEWLSNKKDTSIENGCREDLIAYASQLQKREVKIYMRALALLYRWLGNNDLKELAHCMRKAEISKSRRVFKLIDFCGIKQDDISKLEVLGIKNVEDMLSAGKTPQMRKELVEKSGLSPDVILELVRLSDLSRLPGVKGIRARLYLDAGIKAVEAFSHWEPEALQIYLEKFVQETGFQGIAPLPKEIKSTIKHASQLPRIIK